MFRVILLCTLGLSFSISGMLQQVNQSSIKMLSTTCFGKENFIVPKKNSLTPLNGIESIWRGNWYGKGSLILIGTGLATKNFINWQK